VEQFGKMQMKLQKLLEWKF